MEHIAPIILVIATLSLGAKTANADHGGRREHGTPIIRNYTVDDFAKNAEGEGAQAWSIVEDQRGVMYFGLWRNIAQFDGQHWKLIPLPTGPAYGLTVDRDGTIYVSMVGDFGYLAGDDKGTYHFVSLLDKLPEALRKVTIVWSVHATTHGVYFVTSDLIYRYDKGMMEVLRDEAAYRGFSVDDDVYSRQKNNLAVVREGRIHPIPYFDDLDIAEVGKVIV